MKTLFVTVCILTIISFLIFNFKGFIKKYIDEDIYEIMSEFVQVSGICLGIWLLYWIILV